MTAFQLKAWRFQRNLSQEQAAKALGCSRRSLQHWEAGKNKIPKSIAMAVAAASMGLPPYGARKASDTN